MTSATTCPSAELGAPAFACTPDAFPDLLAVAIDGGDIAAWAHRKDLTGAPGARWVQ